MARPSPETELRDIVFVAFDTETTGLSPVASKLVELSGVKFRTDGSVVSTFAQLINPECLIPAEVTSVHGITDSMVNGQPTYREVIPDFLRWLGEDEVVLAAHNASFDLGFLDISMARLRIPAPDYDVIDTLTLTRRLVPTAPSHQLRILTEFFGLESGSYHRALADSYHVKDLLISMFPLVPECRTWGDFAGLCGVLSFSDLCEEGFAQIETMPEGFAPIKDAILSNVPLQLIYNNTHMFKRTVTPLAVHTWKGRLYLSAFCHAAQAERTFRLDKIVSLKLLPDAAPSISVP